MFRSRQRQAFPNVFIFHPSQQTNTHAIHSFYRKLYACILLFSEQIQLLKIKIRLQVPYFLKLLFSNQQKCGENLYENMCARRERQCRGSLHSKWTRYRGSFHAWLDSNIHVNNTCVLNKMRFVPVYRKLHTLNGEQFVFFSVIGRHHTNSPW